MQHDRAKHGSMLGVAAAAIGTLVFTQAAAGDVDVIFQPIDEVVTVGEVLEIQVILASDSGRTELVAAAEAIFTWEPDKLQLLGNEEDGSVELLTSTFPTNHPSGLNESNPPKDGIGMYMAWAPLGDPVAVTPDGILLTTFLFEALEPATETFIDIIPFIGDPDDPEAKTIVFDGVIPNNDITGSLTSATVTILPSCLGDLNDDGQVDTEDLFILLAAWGPCSDPQECPADLNMDAEVNTEDLFMLLANWGVCP